MIKRALAFITKTEMVKHMAVLAGGTAIAQIIAFLSTTLLSRLYTEADYGEFGVFTSVVAFFVAVSSLRLENAIVLPKEDEEANSIAQWTLKLNCFFALLATAGVVGYMLIKPLAFYYFLLGPTVLFMGVIQVFNFYSTRQKSYSFNSKSRILISIAIALVSLVLGYFSFGDLGLIIGFIAGQLVGALFLYKSIYREIISTPNTLTWKALRTKYKDFLYVSTPHVFFDLIQSSGVIILMSSFFADALIGAYFFAIRVLKIPVSLIGSSIYQVFYQDVSQNFASKQPVLDTINSILKKLVYLSIPIFTILMLFGDRIFVLVFGDKWLSSGEFSMILAPWFLLNLFSSTLSFVPLVFNRQKTSFVLAIANTSVKVLTTIICGYFYDFYTLIYVYAITQSLAMLINLAWYYAIVLRYEKSLIKTEEL